MFVDKSISFTELNEAEKIFLNSVHMLLWRVQNQRTNIVQAFFLQQSWIFQVESYSFSTSNSPKHFISRILYVNSFDNIIVKWWQETLHFLLHAVAIMVRNTTLLHDGVNVFSLERYSCKFWYWAIITQWEAGTAPASFLPYLCLSFEITYRRDLG